MRRNRQNDLPKSKILFGKNHRIPSAALLVIEFVEFLYLRVGTLLKLAGDKCETAI